MKTIDEQAERILDNLKDFDENPEDYTYQEWEDMFEDRDPFEFFQDLTNTPKGGRSHFFLFVNPFTITLKIPKLFSRNTCYSQQLLLK